MSLFRHTRTKPYTLTILATRRRGMALHASNHRRVAVLDGGTGAYLLSHVTRTHVHPSLLVGPPSLTPHHHPRRGTSHSSGRHGRPQDVVCDGGLRRDLPRHPPKRPHGLSASRQRVHNRQQLCAHPGRIWRLGGVVMSDQATDTHCWRDRSGGGRYRDGTRTKRTEARPREPPAPDRVVQTRLGHE